MVSWILQREGFTVETFADGRCALDFAREAPDLILLDYMMPRLAAPEFLLARKQHAVLRDPPVVVISAYPELADTVVAETVGVVHKPIDMEILLECVRYHCRESAPSSGAGRATPLPSTFP
jgi:two-component system, OmpR family, phosphate regulon response regulator PhoB